MAMRAMAESPALARICGVEVDKVVRLDLGRERRACRSGRRLRSG